MTEREQMHVGRYLRTVAHLRPAQVAHRVRLRSQQAALRRWPAPFERRWSVAAGSSRWPERFTAVDALAPPACGSFDDLERGRFTFLGETRELGEPVAWDPPGASQLWLYHLHYWEWAWTLCRDPDREQARSVFERRLQSWRRAAPFGRWNAWAPYPTSLRAWVLVNVGPHLVRGGPIERDLHDLLGLHAGFVEHNLELDVGGNHLVKNLKALLGLGVFMGDDRLVAKAVAHLRRQLRAQVLGDGGHFELSPSYHCQVLGDLLDIAALLGAAGRPTIDGLDDAIAGMQSWLATMRMPDGDLPLFNDAERIGATRIDGLSPGSRPPGPLTVLGPSGYVVARPTARVHLVVDVGRPCPLGLPAHAHADCLTFELAVDGRRVVVDPGTSVYASGPQRRWERGTPAHNTVTIDGMDQTEVWGSFRAGRRAEATLHHARVDGQGVDIAASHTGFRNLPGAPVHHRRWQVTADRIDITDRIDGEGRHTVDQRLLLDAARVQVVASGRVHCDGCRISVRRDGGATVEPAAHSVPARYATGHGVGHDGIAVQGRWTAELPIEICTTIELTSPA